MPRSNFISTEFFIEANEEKTKRILYSITDADAACRFMTMSVHQPIFHFLLLQEKIIFKLAVIYLPLNDDFTKITIRISYADGHAFCGGRNCRQVLKRIENIICCLAKGVPITGEPTAKSPARFSNLFSFATHLFSK